MTDRDRQNRYWDQEQEWRERERAWSRHNQPQSWQAPEPDWARERGLPLQYQDYGSERGSGSPRDYGRDYGGRQQYGYRGEPGGYGANQQGRMLRRGPKNYTRSDERIREDVCERLMQSDLDASDVTVEVRQATVILEGSVPERRIKYIIEDIAEQCLGVTDVDNNLRVSREGRDTGWSRDRESAEVDGLNRCLRSELSAIETYRQALDRDRDEYGTQTEFQRLSEILRDHEDAASRLRHLTRQRGGDPSDDAGAWGTWSKIIMGAAKLFGDKAALKALKEGEESGFKEYDRFQRESNPSREALDLTSELMGHVQRHIRELDSLIAALERR